MKEKVGMTTQMMKDEAPQRHVTPLQPKQPVRHIQIVQQIQVQPKQQAPALVQKKKGKRDQPSNLNDIDELGIIQERLATLQKEKEDLKIPESDSFWQQLIGAIDNNNNLTPRSAQKQLQEMVQQAISNEKQQQQTTGFKAQQRIISPIPRIINTGMNKNKPVIQPQLSVTPTQKPQHRAGMRQRLKKAERELELLKAEQQLRQQENNDLNNQNIEKADIQGTIGQLTGLQPNPSAESPGLNARLKPTEVGSIPASNREKTVRQINKDHDDKADEEEDEQTDEAALNQNKDYRVNVISQPPVQENLGSQSQNIQGLNPLNQMEKDETCPVPVGVHEKPKKVRGSKKAKAGDLIAPAEQNQGNNAQDQTNKASKTPKLKAAS
ncbi:MAG: hypothetical protein EZS28_046085, partial [Streblomastix strix]